MDRAAGRQWASELGLLLLIGCAPSLPPLPMPVELAPVSREAAVQWADSTRPLGYRDIRFRFQFRNEEGSAGGRGRARFGFPDSIRFDLSGPLGAYHASAFVIGDSAFWAEPEDEVRKLVPNYPLFWAMLGVVRPPEPGSEVRHFGDGRTTAWQFASGGDTVEYVRELGPKARLIAEVRRGGKRVGRVETRLDPAGLPASARLVVPKPAARLDLTFSQNVKTDSFPADTWIRPAREP